MADIRGLSSAGQPLDVRVDRGGRIFTSGGGQVGAENLTVSTVAIPLAAPDGDRALIYVGGAPIRWRADGTPPTATTGMYVAAGGYIDWTGGDWASMIQNVSFIRDTTAGSNATLAVVYFE